MERTVAATQAVVRVGPLAALVHSLITPGSSRTCELTADAALFGRRAVPYAEILDITVRTGPLWSAVRVQSRAAPDTVLPGLSRRAADALRTELDTRAEHAASALYTEKQDRIAATHRALDDLRSSPRFVTAKRLARWFEDCRRLLSQLPARVPRQTPQPDAVGQALALRKAVESRDELRGELHSSFLERELASRQEFFDHVVSQPLTLEQRRAVVLDESRNLIVAAAGSGKTATMVAKAAYVIRSGHCRPDEVLILAFARDAADELRARLAEQLDPQATELITATTFHALGLGIIGAVEGSRPRVARESDDHIAVRKRVRDAAAGAMKDPTISRRMLEWFRSHFAPYRSELEFNTQGEYLRYVSEHELRSLAGELVRSYEECEIANFLYLNSVEYRYEPSYPHEPGDPEHGPYTPDFYLPEHDLYIEHFGIARDGSTAPFVPQQRYHEHMAWKRAAHERHGTSLLETYSYEKAEGTLLTGLARKLAAAGVTLEPRPMEDAFDALERLGRVDHFTALTTTFMRHFKGGGYSIGDLRTRADAAKRSDRAHAYVDVFEGLLASYERGMQDTREIDFEDMILRATEYASTRRFESPYRYVLVDEFQDISRGRARLLKALLDQHPDSRLFAVGDDWQSIYRFAGADLSLMTQFAAHFGTTERVDLSRTFRCVDRVSDVATTFVTRNPGQLVKSVRSTHHAAATRVHVVFAGSAAPRAIRGILRVVERELGESASVLLLGRYRRSAPADLDELHSEFPALDLRFLTIHRSKGLEADAVIVLGLNAGKQGFPSEARDDPLLDLVLAHPEPFHRAEERRLLYVALTRARHAAYLMVTEGPPSEFVEELSAGGYDVDVFGDAVLDLPACPDCESTRLTRREGEYGQFWGCLNYPLCTVTRDACRKCKIGWIAPNGTTDTQTCGSCGAVVPICIECDDGLMVLRESQFGEFLGCTNYPRCQATRDRRRR